MGRRVCPDRVGYRRWQGGRRSSGRGPPALTATRGAPAMPRWSSNDTSIGDRIRERRQLRGWSVRHAADRAGIAASTWSRVERGLRSADNRFLLAEIATALECSVSDIAGLPASTSDPDLAAALAGVAAVREAFLDAELDVEPGGEPRPLPELEREAELVWDLRLRCEYAGAI